MAIGTAAAIIGGSVLGAGIAGSAAKSAAKTQAKAANNATNLQKQMFDTTNQQQAPYREAGYTALNDLLGMRNFDPTPDAASVMAEPGYQFGMQQGMRGIENSAAARGLALSGAALKAASRFNSDYAGTRYNDAFNRAQTSFGNRWNRLANLAGIGQAANQQTQQAGQNYANMAGQNMMGAANASAAAGMARGNIYGSALNSIISQGNRANWWQQGPQVVDNYNYFADPTQIPMQPGGGS
jgi:hypothetical protein